ncbi:MAG TPA: sigma-70 family RNA polymerase sigma factor [Iamia sp.]|nr:sigma-70 family RNA polymerase sigma factor [Iamia sp.]
MPQEETSDRTWLRDLFDAEHAPIWRALLAWTGSPTVAEDAVAEAFCQAARRTDLRDPAAWVWKVAFNLAGREMARRRIDVALPEDADPAADDATTLSAATLDLLAALDRLTPQQRGAVVLVDGFGLPSARAAELLDTTPTTVRVQALRARRRLRTALTPIEEAP